MKIPDAEVTEEYVIRWPWNRRWEKPSLSVLAAHLLVCKALEVSIKDPENLLSPRTTRC